VRFPCGSPRGIKIAEITNRVVKAVLIPRNQLENAVKRPEVKNVGLYFLFGTSDESAKPLVYIGEAEDCWERLKQHNRNKEFWSHACLIVSKINTFTKAHVKYLEHLAVQIAQDVNRFKTENGNIPNAPHITESMEADLLDSFETVKILLSTLGYPVFDSINKKEISKKEILYVEGKGVKAEGDLIDDGFVVFQNSGFSATTTKSCHTHILRTRKNLIDEGIVIQKNGFFIFKENYVFGSPSTAAGIVLGRSANGWKEWKNKDGKNLDELKRK
jgi:hypothetical protein